MAQTSLLKKMKLKPGDRAVVLGAPEGYLAALSPLPDGAEVEECLDGQYDWVQLFAKTRVELESAAPAVIASLKSVSLLWVSVPKGSAGLQTDLTRDRGWDLLRKADLKWITLISVNGAWSAFSFRPYKPGEPRQSFRYDHLPMARGRVRGRAAPAGDR